MGLDDAAADLEAEAGPTAAACRIGAVVTSYVARDPGYIVVDGGLDLLDHLWTTNLNATNTRFLGALVNWHQTGLIVSYTGTADPSGCILDSLTVAPAVTIATTSLPAGSFVTVGMKVQWKGLRDPATNTVLTRQIEIN